MNGELAKAVLGGTERLEQLVQAVVREVKIIEAAWRQHDKDASLGLSRKHLQKLVMRYGGELPAAVVNRLELLLRVEQPQLECSLPSTTPIENIGGHDIAVLLQAEQRLEAQIRNRSAA